MDNSSDKIADNLRERVGDSVDNALVGTWRIDIAGNDRFHYTFNADGTERVEHADLNTPDKPPKTWNGVWSANNNELHTAVEVRDEETGARSVYEQTRQYRVYGDKVYTSESFVFRVSGSGSMGEWAASDTYVVDREEEENSWGIDRDAITLADATIELVHEAASESDMDAWPDESLIESRTLKGDILSVDDDIIHFEFTDGLSERQSSKGIICALENTEILWLGEQIDTCDIPENAAQNSPHISVYVRQ